MHGRYETFIQDLVRKPEGKRSLGRRRCRWMHLAQDGDQRQALVNMVMNLQVP
jgi:hypothetical protein